MERAFADVNSMTGGWIEDEIVNQLFSPSQRALKNSKTSLAPSLACTNGFEMESEIVVCTLFCLTEYLGIGISFGRCSFRNFCAFYRFYYERNGLNFSCQWTIDQHIRQPWFHYEEWISFACACLKYGSHRDFQFEIGDCGLASSSIFSCEISMTVEEQAEKPIGVMC
jgi:hypothetical protein